MKKALLIGINYLNNPQNRLKGCINDTINMKDLLVSEMGYSADNITTLRDDSTISAQQPTRANILNELRKLVNTPDCVELWVTFSGHGTQVRDTTHHKISGMDEVIIPVDYISNGFILDSEIHSIIISASCRMILMFDSCRSGTVCDLPWVYEYQSPTSYVRHSENNEILDNQQIYMFSGCKDTQTSADAYNRVHNEYTGAFTSAFIDCMKAAPPSINILTLYRNICVLLKKENFVQLPDLSSSSPVPNMVITKTTSLLTSGARYMNSLITATKGINELPKHDFSMFKMQILPKKIPLLRMT